MTTDSSSTSTNKKKKTRKINLTIINECDICMETYNTKNNKPVLCEYCPMEACRSCCERYILGENTIKCMSVYCNSEWSRKYIASQFTPSFINGQLKEHRKSILYDKERAKFPYTIEKMNILDDVEIKLDTYDIKQIRTNIHSINKKRRDVLERFTFQKEGFIKLIKKHNKKNMEEHKKIQNDAAAADSYSIWNEFARKYHVVVDKIITREITKETFVAPTIPSNVKISGTKQKLVRLFDKLINSFFKNNDEVNELNKIQEQNEKMYDDWVDLEQLQADTWNEIGTTTTQVKQPTNTHKCPTPECNGILNAEWHCILCKVNACSSCHEVVDEEHKCNPDTIETIKMLKKDTKACPKCHTNIYKIDGCDQMWCVQCHTAFSWKTGNIETKIHNPHYYEWMRKNSANGVIAREVGDNHGPACEAINDNAVIIYMNAVTSYLQEMRKYNIVDENVIQCVESNTNDFMINVQNLVHLNEVVLPRHTGVIDITSEFITRSKFLKKEIDEKKYKMFLEKEAKKTNKNTEVRQLIQLWIDAKTDILRRVMGVIRTQPITLESVLVSIHTQKKIMNEMIDLDAYVHSSAKEIENIYKNVVKLN